MGKRGVEGGVANVPVVPVVDISAEVTLERVADTGEVLRCAVSAGGFEGGDISAFSVADLVVFRRMIAVAIAEIEPTLSSQEAYVSFVIKRVRDDFAQRLLAMRIPCKAIDDYLTRVYAFEPSVLDIVAKQVENRLLELGAGNIKGFEADDEEEADEGDEDDGDE